MSTTFQFATAWLEARTRSDRAASLVEYAVLVALVALVGIVCAAAVTFLGGTSEPTAVSSSLR